MTLGFRRLSKDEYTPTDDCDYCCTPLERGNVWGHKVASRDNKSVIHYIWHQECAKEWYTRYPNPICQFCKETINTKPLFSWKDKTVSELKFVLRDAANVDTNDLTALAVGALAGGWGGMEVGREVTALAFDAAVAGGVIGGLSELILFIKNFDLHYQDVESGVRGAVADVRPIVNQTLRVNQALEISNHENLQQRINDIGILSTNLSDHHIPIKITLAGTAIAMTTYGTIIKGSVASVAAAAGATVALATLGTGPVVAAGAAMATGGALTLTAQAGYRVVAGLFNRHLM